MLELSEVVRIIWYMTTAAKAVALIALWRRGLLSRYIVFCAGLAGSLCGSLWLTYLWLTAGLDAYRDAWLIVQPVELGIVTVWVIDSFMMQARHLRRIGSFGAVLGLTFAALGLLAILATQGWFINGLPGLMIVLVTRHFALACLVFLVASRAWFYRRERVAARKGFPWRIRRNAVAHSLLLMLLMLGSALGNGISYTGRPFLMTLGMLFMQISALMAFVAWAFTLDRAGEEWTPPPDMSEAEVRDRDRHWAARWWNATRSYICARKGILYVPPTSWDTSADTSGWGSTGQ